MKKITKPAVRVFTVFILFFVSPGIFAATNYVGTSGTPGGNYYTDIQSAVEATSGGDFVLVSNGTYILSSQIDVTNSLRIQSVNGPKNTIVDGNSSVLCFSLYNHNTVVSGFTITNGNTGGVRCNDTTPVITNCIIIGNSTLGSGGGTYAGTVNNCIISGNSANNGGGTFHSIINNCTISKNLASEDAGGTYCSTVNNSTISGNSAGNEGGGTFWYTINNCIISGNSANNGGGTFHSIINNCTISENSASHAGGGTFNGSVFNSIIWSNSASITSNNVCNGNIRYSCTFPLPYGGGNISNDPEFVSYIDRDWRLESTSPCINAGTNAFAPMPVDLDGNPRIIDGTVDMGCYEFVPEPFYLRFAMFYLLFAILRWRKFIANG